MIFKNIYENKINYVDDSKYSLSKKIINNMPNNDNTDVDIQI